MEIKFEKKPSQEVVDQYCRKIEEFLSAYSLSCSIELFREPIRIEWHVGDKLSRVKNYWIKKVTIKSGEIGELRVELLNKGIDEGIDNDKIWHDAWRIQQQVCKHLDSFPKGCPSAEEHPYWKLWDYWKD